MADRGGKPGGGRGGGERRGGGGGDRGGRGGGKGGNQNRGEKGNQQQRPITGGPTLPKKENILDLGKYMDKQIRVKFAGGRVVTGLLKGFDPLLNLVLDETVEEQFTESESVKDPVMRSLGLVVCRGTTVILISPVDGTEEIANPFQ
ncbi:Sm-like protein lsm7 [Blyttiomyces sp. JEL0837]|nr:Sm-like protein lsm7 [Blyttiomyces sp. JEL0837]